MRLSGEPVVSMTLARNIPYNPTPRTILLFAGFGAISFVCGALSVLPRVSFPISVFFLSIASLTLLRRFVWRRDLTLAEDAIIVPSGFLRLRPIRIPYDQINNVWVHRVVITSVICIRIAERQVEIQDMYLPDSATFQNLKEFLESAVESRRA